MKWRLCSRCKRGVPRKRCPTCRKKNVPKSGNPETFNQKMKRKMLNEVRSSPSGN